MHTSTPAPRRRRPALQVDRNPELRNNPRVRAVVSRVKSAVAQALERRHANEAVDEEEEEDSD